jgi:hypothetical protein
MGDYNYVAATRTAGRRLKRAKQHDRLPGDRRLPYRARRREHDSDSPGTGQRLHRDVREHGYC